MKTPSHSRTLLLAIASLTITLVAKAGDYHAFKTLPIGGEGAYDYLTADAASRRLYVSHSTKVVVIDMDKNEVVGEIAETPGVHGIAIAPDLKRGFTSNGRESKVSLFDLETFKTEMKVGTGANPDAILYEPSQHEVYTFNGRGLSATVLEAKSGKTIATIPLSGKPEFAVADTKAGLIYCNIEDKNSIAVIDSRTHKVVHDWPIAPGAEATGMAIDLEHKRLFIGCHNKLMAMIDATSGKVIATVPIEGGVDATAFDASSQLVFSSNGEGTVTIAHEDSPNAFHVVQTLKTERGARTLALDEKTHRIYLAVGSGAAFKVISYGP